MKTVYRNKGGRVVGKVVDGVFKKSVSREKHLFRKLEAYAVQESVLRELPDETRIEIYEKDTQTLYVTTAREFRENCQYLSFGENGLQGFLPLEFFKIEKPTASVLAVPQWN